MPILLLMINFWLKFYNDNVSDFEWALSEKSDVLN